MKACNNANVHRFRNYVVVRVGNGDCVYLTSTQARKLARALYVGARDVETHDFQNSSFSGRHIDFTKEK